MNVSKKMKNVQKCEPQESSKSEVESGNEFNLNVEWNSHDKRILLEALKKYGSKDIAAISKMLPNMPCQAIKSKISEYSTTAKRLYENELIDKWMKCGLYKPGDSVIPEALLFIQLFENHPSPSEVEGYDFRAIYDFLYRSCLEQTSIFNLSQKDRDLLCSSLSKIEDKVWPAYEKDIWEYVGRVYNRRNIKKVYRGKNLHSL